MKKTKVGKDNGTICHHFCHYYKNIPVYTSLCVLGMWARNEESLEKQKKRWNDFCNLMISTKSPTVFINSLELIPPIPSIQELPNEVRELLMELDKRLESFKACFGHELDESHEKLLKQGDVETLNDFYQSIADEYTKFAIKYPELESFTQKYDRVYRFTE